MKKIISVLLCLVLLFTVFSTAVMAAGETVKGDIPVIYLMGRNNKPIIKADGTVADNAKELDRLEYIGSVAGPVFEEFAKACLTGDYSDWVDSLVGSIEPIYDDWRLDPDGTATEVGSYIDWNPATCKITKKTSGYNIKDYVFYYDWRLSPFDVADQLDTYIERVCAATGHDKVNIHARCLGANFAVAYIYNSHNGKYEHDFRVANLALNTSALGGYISAGALFSNQINFDPDVIDQYATIYGENAFDEPLYNTILTTMVSVCNMATVLGWGTDLVDKIYTETKEELVPRIIMASYGGFPSYWSMISDSYYDKAMQAVFYNDALRQEYAGLIQRADNYHEKLGKINEETGYTGYEQLLLDCEQEHDMSTIVLAKYGKPFIPVIENSNLTGDARGTATELSLGATCTTVDEIFSEEYIAEARAKGTDKYISKDLTVDASTCLFPDTTWFAKNLKHEDWPEEFHNLALAFFNSNGELTVWDEEAILAQFVEYDSDRGEFVEVTEPSDSGWTDNKMSILVKFIKMVIEILMSLFSRVI